MTSGGEGEKWDEYITGGDGRLRSYGRGMGGGVRRKKVRRRETQDGWDRMRGSISRMSYGWLG